MSQNSGNQGNARSTGSQDNKNEGKASNASGGNNANAGNQNQKNAGKASNSNSNNVGTSPGSHTRGGSAEQHAASGRQSHKNDK